MRALQMFLVAILVGVAGYTAVVVANHGMGLFPVFFGDMVAMTWPGQFNLDFFCFLMLSALWVAWRHRFLPAGLGLAVVALLGGAPFLAAYLLVASRGLNGDFATLLLGPERAGST